MNESHSIAKILFLVCALILAVVLGSMLATDQNTALVWVVGVAMFAVCVSMKQRIWLLIPLLGSMDLGLRLPGSPSTMLLAQILVISFTALLFLMRKLPYKIAITELEFWAVILFACIGQVYVRNPLGLNVFGGGMVGGRPYAIAALDLFVGLIYCGIRLHPKELKWYLSLSILGGLMGTAMSVIGNYVPAIGYMLGSSYIDQSVANYDDFGKVVDEGAATRLGFLEGFARKSGVWLPSFISPLRALVHPLWLLLLLVIVGAAAMSGFRNSLIMVGMTFVVGIAYRGGISSLMISALLGAVVVALLAICNTVSPLPPNIQRSLTFLPGTWEERYRLDAKASSDWRYEMWMEVLTSEKWIQNKWWGDGLGMTADALQRSINLGQKRKGISGFDELRETILINGNYHSGPVQTIRTIGYVGLLLLLIAQIRLAVHAHRQIMRCKDTEWYPVSLFVGIPLVVNPFFFTLVFGEFQSAMTIFLIGAGMVRMLQNNLPLPAWTRPDRLPYVLRGKHALG